MLLTNKKEEISRQKFFIGKNNEKLSKNFLYSDLNIFQTFQIIRSTIRVCSRMKFFFETQVPNTSFFQEPEFSTKTRVFSFYSLKRIKQWNKFFFTNFDYNKFQNFQNLQNKELGKWNFGLVRISELPDNKYFRFTMKNIFSKLNIFSNLSANFKKFFFKKYLFTKIIFN